MARRPLQLLPHLTPDELRRRYRACHDAKEARRWHALWLVSQGYSPPHAAAIVGLQPSWVRRIIHCYNQAGPDAVADGHCRHPGGRRCRLTPAQQHALAAALQAPPPGGGRWTGAKVAAWIEQATGRQTYPQLGWVYLRRLAPADPPDTTD